MRLRSVVAVVMVLLVGFAAITLTALEGNEVVVVRTREADGGMRETRVWVAEQDGALWVEAATPERDFYRDLVAQPSAELVRGERTLQVIAHPDPGATGHQRIRTLLAAKYGWADHWVALLQDTSRSVAIRFDPLPPAGRAPQ
jgi:F420H(2)-dependent quinone reductase